MFDYSAVVVGVIVTVGALINTYVVKGEGIETRKAVLDVHMLVNSGLDQWRKDADALLQLTKQAALAEGTVVGQATEKARQDAITVAAMPSTIIKATE